MVKRALLGFVSCWLAFWLPAVSLAAPFVQGLPAMLQGPLPRPEAGIEGMKVVVVIYNLEMEPWVFFKEALEMQGVEVYLASSAERVWGLGPSLLEGGTQVDLLIEDINPEEFDGIVLGAGRPIAPLFAERGPELLELLRAFDAQGKLVGAFCNNSPVLVAAGIVESAPGHTEQVTRLKDNVVVAAMPTTWQEFSDAMVEILKEQKEQDEEAVLSTNQAERG